MTDSNVQIPPASTGQKIDTSKLMREDTTEVERQRITLGDSVDPNKLANVSVQGELAVSIKLDAIEGQLKRIALLLEIMTQQTISLDDVRN